jgi:hypothetical protein
VPVFYIAAIHKLAEVVEQVAEDKEKVCPHYVLRPHSSK